MCALTQPSKSYSDRPPRRTALVSAELRRYNIDIAAISETRLPDEDSITEVGEGYTFYWKGLSADSARIHEVGFAVKTKLARRLPEAPVGVNERLDDSPHTASQEKTCHLDQHIRFNSHIPRRCQECLL